jgi:hypothetical protein
LTEVERERQRRPVGDGIVTRHENAMPLGGDAANDALACGTQDIGAGSAEFSGAMVQAQRGGAGIDVTAGAKRQERCDLVGRHRLRS